MEHERTNTSKTEKLPDFSDEKEKTIQDMAKNDVLPYLTLEELSDEDVSQVLDFLSNEIEIASSGDSWYSMIERTDDLLKSFGNTSTAKEREACKLLYAATIDYAKEQRAANLNWKEEFSFTETMSQYAEICTLGDYLELLDVAEEAGASGYSYVHHLYSQIMYNDFTDEEYSNVFSNRSAISSLRLIPIMYNMTRYFVDDDDGDSVSMYNKVNCTLHLLANDKDTTPLVKLSAKSYGDSLDSDSTMANLRMLGIFGDDLGMVRFGNNGWEKDVDGYIKISPGVTALINNDDRMSVLKYKDGKEFSLLHYKDDNPIGLDRDSVFLISTAHVPMVKKIINEKLGFDLAEIPLDAQVHLLKFMTEADDGRFDRLCGTMHELNGDLRLKLAENFLAADFGEDFGDALLTVAESTRFDDKEKEAILDNITSCRESIKSITGLYEHIDGEFAKEGARAANERLTDAITVFAEIAKKGHAEADLGWAGHPRFDYKTALEALEYERKSLEIISGTFSDIIDGKDGVYAKVILHPNEEFQRLRRTVYDLYSPNHGHILIYTRADGSHSFDPDVEYGKIGSKYNLNSKNTGVEASISMIVDPVDPFSSINPYKPDKRAIKNPNYYDDTTMNKVSALRYDREGRELEWAADDPKRDPVNPFGIVSVDLAAIGDRADTPSGKIARLLAVGNSLRASRMGGETSLNHNTNWFNQAKYGTSDGFKKIVEGFDMSLRRLVEIRQPRARLKKLGKIANTTKTGDDPAA